MTAISGNSLTLDKPLTTCTSARSPTASTSAAKSACFRVTSRSRPPRTPRRPILAATSWRWPTPKCISPASSSIAWARTCNLARYPIHWHVLGEGKGQYIKNASIHDTYNRCVTVHGTNNLRVENNVTYNTVGHCFFMEDGIEHGNEFIKKPGNSDQVQSDKGLSAPKPCRQRRAWLSVFAAFGHEESQLLRQDTLLPSDNTVSSFWITNPDNSYIDNVRAGSDETGFWLSMPEHPNGAFLGSEVALKPGRAGRRCARSGVTCPIPTSTGSCSTGTSSKTHLRTVLQRVYAVGKSCRPEQRDGGNAHRHLTSYKNRNGGLWSRGELLIFRNAKFADNAIGMTNSTGTFGSERFTGRLVDSLIVAKPPTRAIRQRQWKSPMAVVCRSLICRISRSAATNIMITVMKS